MAQSERTFAELETLLASGGDRTISAQDVRDLMVSCLGGYASLNVVGNVAAQAFTGTPAVVTAFDGIGPELGPAASHAANTITINVSGVYSVEFRASVIAAATPNALIELFNDGVQELEIAPCQLDMTATSWPVAFGGQLSLTAGEVLDVRASVTPSGNLTFTHAQLTVKRVG